MSIGLSISARCRLEPRGLAALTLTNKVSTWLDCLDVRRGVGFVAHCLLLHLVLLLDLLQNVCIGIVMRVLCRVLLPKHICVIDMIKCVAIVSCSIARECCLSHVVTSCGLASWIIGRTVLGCGCSGGITRAKRLLVVSLAALACILLFL